MHVQVVSIELSNTTPSRFVETQAVDGWFAGLFIDQANIGTLTGGLTITDQNGMDVLHGQADDITAADVTFTRDDIGGLAVKHPLTFALTSPGGAGSITAHLYILE